MIFSICKSSLMAAFTLVLSGCAGHLYTTVNPPLDQNNTKIEGIITYPQIGVYELYKMTLFVDTNGNIKNDKCVADYLTVYSVRSDYSHPQFVSYAPGLFENNSFNLALKDGNISSISTTSDTTGALKEIIDVLKPFISASAARLPQDKNLLCNAGKKLVGIYKAPDALPFEDMEKETNKK